MTVHSQRFDAVVVGAGTTGAAAAGMLARGGLAVALVERRRLEHAGARWVNDVPPWLFDSARVARPAGIEKQCDREPIALFGNGARTSVRLTRPMWGVDCRALGDRLRQEALGAGVTAFERAEVEACEVTAGRVVAVALTERTEHGLLPRQLRLEARLFIDASGVAGALRKRLAALGSWPEPTQDELASAAQQVCTVASAPGARAFLGRYGARPGEVVSRTGLDSGYSTLAVRVEPGLGRVELLSGIGCSAGRTAGPDMLRRLKASEPWIGAMEYGGAGLIPIRRPYDRLVTPGFALVGDAACQAFPAHGSGVGAGLVAARMLADAVVHSPDPGRLEALWRYASRFQRELGGVHAGYDVLRRFTVGLAPEDVRALVDDGVLSPPLVLSGMDQRMPALDLGELVPALRGALRWPRLAAALFAHAPRLFAARAAYLAYPATPGEGALAAWARFAAGAAGHAADVRG
ncbi:MAG: hypothetical protein IT373_09645 [Polyangiaceae bacterium]|nr:hypothetical protein [Polyangiaceae bacterium]